MNQTVDRRHVISDQQYLECRPNCVNLIFHRTTPLHSYFHKSLLCDIRFPTSSNLFASSHSYKHTAIHESELDPTGLIKFLFSPISPHSSMRYMSVMTQTGIMSGLLPWQTVTSGLQHLHSCWLN